jgi:hypothetical protein
MREAIFRLRHLLNWSRAFLCTVPGCHSLYLRDAAPGKLRGLSDAHASISEADNAAMMRKVGFAPVYLPSRLAISIPWR